MRTAIVTGTNGYLGMAICHRLIDETPQDVALRIVATSRTFRAVIQAVKTLQSYVWKNYPDRKANVEFDYVLFDQCDMVSVYGAALEIKKRYPKIDYVFFNSSYSTLGGIDYVQATKDFFTQPLKAFTVGTFKIQGQVRISRDGMGSGFEANVFSPYFLAMEILPNVQAANGRLIWISTSISLPEYFKRSDLGITDNLHSYEASKYELELLHQGTYQKLLQQGVQSWLLQPGVFKSTTFVPTLNIFSYIGMFVMFYICRWLGSPYHCIYPELAANAPLFLALHADPKKNDMSIKYGSGTTRCGKEKLMETPINAPAEDVEAVTEYVENLRAEWKKKLRDQVVERVNY